MNSSNTVFIHPKALVDEGAAIGDGTRVWAFAHVVRGAVVGKDCNLCDHTFVEGSVIIGNRVTIKCGVHLWDGIVVADDVFIGPGAGFANDPRPRSKQHPHEYSKTILQQGCSVGVNASVLSGLTIGKWSMVGAGAVVTRDVPAHALVIGNPAQFRCWVCRCASKLVFADNIARCACGRAFTLLSDNKVEEKTHAP